MADSISSETLKAIIDRVVEKLRSPATPMSREDGWPQDGLTDSDPGTSSSVPQGKSQWVIDSREQFHLHQLGCERTVGM